MASANKQHTKTVCKNRKARFHYHIEDVFEAGIVLTGTEVKSLRAGKGSLAESYAQASGDEIFLTNFHIQPYEHGNIHNGDPVRKRKLLLHRKEIDRIIADVSRKRYTLVPLSVYFKNGRVKVELAVGVGKKLYDKRQDLKRKDQERDMTRAMRQERK